MRARVFPMGNWKGSLLARVSLLALVVGMVAACGGCGDKPKPISSESTAPGTAASESRVRVTSGEGGTVVITPSAEFVVLPSGYLKASLISGEKKLSLDDANDAGLKIIAGGKQRPDVAFDVAYPKISESNGRLGTQGKRIEISGRGASALDASLVVEVYDEFPNMAAISISLRNSGNQEMRLDSVDLDRHRLNASLADAAKRSACADPDQRNRASFPGCRSFSAKLKSPPYSEIRRRPRHKTRVERACSCTRISIRFPCVPSRPFDSDIFGYATSKATSGRCSTAMIFRPASLASSSE